MAKQTYRICQITKNVYQVTTIPKIEAIIIIDITMAVI